MAVDSDKIDEHGNVALEVAYRVLRAQIVANVRRRAFASASESSGSFSNGKVHLDADALLAKSRAVLAACDRLRRMKRNCTDAENMVRVSAQVRARNKLRRLAVPLLMCFGSSEFLCTKIKLTNIRE